MMYSDNTQRIVSTCLKSSLWLLFVFLNGCQTDLPEWTWRGTTMGTNYQVKVTGVEISETGYKQLHQQINSALVEVNRQMSTYDSASEISMFNSFSETSSFPVSEAFVNVLRTALDVYKQSNGAFDITVGPLVELWGFGAAKSNQQIPSEKVIHSILEKVGSDHLHIRSDTVIQKDLPGLKIDLGAIAKGYGVDVVAQILDREGFKHFLVEIGGEVVARGQNAKREKWKIGIDRPDFANLPGQQLVRVLAISDIAVATSGDYRNYFELEGKIYSHTINPVTGRPVTHGLASVTVIAPNCMLADALATAVMVMGPREGLSFIEKFSGIEAMLIERTDQMSLTEHQTSGFGKFIFEGG